ncbi:MAG: acyl-CoA thioesterase [Gammaproteobacteria bacterium]|nr:acyl-CoA thioesterase [Gammaproteobacteria bacterium]
MHSTEIEITIPFHDVDAMQIVWHGWYVKYFELARCALLDQINYSYEEMFASGYSWPVVDMRIKYIKPICFNQIIKIQARLVEWEYRLKINYIVCDVEKKERLTKGYTTQVAVDLASGEMCWESPRILWEKLGLNEA